MKKTLLLVDGSSYLYRAFHAMPDLRTVHGTPSGAIYGVINMLRKLLRDYQTNYVAFIFDAPGKTFREKLYPNYKSHRPSMPKDLVAQVEPILLAIRALGWPTISIDGLEADDIIGTLARLAANQGIFTTISTGDKDLIQLINEHVILVNTMNRETLDSSSVIIKFGISPNLIIDYLMLVGDTSDNIPGVTKVGPRTALKWLKKYGSLDNLVKEADTVKGSLGDHLRSAIHYFPLTRKLLTIKCDCDLRSHVNNVTDLVLRSPNKPVLIDLYRRYGFYAWLDEITSPLQNTTAFQKNCPSEEDPKSLPNRYEMINTWPRFNACLESIKRKTIAVLNLETIVSDNKQIEIVGISIATKPNWAYYIPVDHSVIDNSIKQLPKEKVLARLRCWLEDDDSPKILYHAKNGLHALASVGIHLTGIAEDVMLKGYVLESHCDTSLSGLTKRFLKHDLMAHHTLQEQNTKKLSFDKICIEDATKYACSNADSIIKLNHDLRSKFISNPVLENIYRLEMQVLVILFMIERLGVKINSEELNHQGTLLSQEIFELEKSAHGLAGQSFNLNSPKQVGKILFGVMKLPILRKTRNGAPSTDEDVLSRLAPTYSLPKILLEYRVLSKLESNYVNKLPRMINPFTGRIHTHYSQVSVITGRLASSEPNLQNIPIRTELGRRVRSSFISEQGWLVSADYSQIELRIMAHVSNDSNLQRAFISGEDVHRTTAAEIFGTSIQDVTTEARRSAKAINFGLIYGMGVFGLASTLGITRYEAQAYMDRYFSRYPGVVEYMESTRILARKQGYVQTVFGRRLWLPEIKEVSKLRREAAERSAINATIQGTAADLIKMAMVAVQRWIDTKDLKKTRMIMQVHDELILEVPEKDIESVKASLSGLMCNVAQLKVPLIAKLGVGRNWGEAH